MAGLDDYEVRMDSHQNHPANSDQLRSQTIKVVKEADSWICFAHSGGDLHAIYSRGPHTNDVEFLKASAAALDAFFERILEESDGSEET